MRPSGARPLLSAKLVIPLPREGTVRRVRLHERLIAAGRTPLTTVVAPAGWGKTTLLSAWAHDPDEHRPIGWLSIDEEDDEPVRFWTYALAALDTVAPGVAGRALAALAAPGIDPLGVALAELLNELTDAAQEYVLVLDDYHVLTDPAIHASVEFVIGYLPRALRLVIAGRADPQLPTARWRARGMLTEVRVGDLRCTLAEGAALASAVADLSPSVANGLVERTEGWPAGLQLAALTVSRSANPEAAAAEMRGGSRHILDYFAAEVLPGVQQAERNLLVRCSVLERLSGPLCDAVLGTVGSAAVLDRLERSDLFVSALGSSWYRCHRLFRDVLKLELEATTPGAGFLALTRAADWFLGEGRVEEAVECRVAAGDDAGAVELLRTHSRWFLDHGAMGALLRMGDRLAGAVSDPRLQLAFAFAAGLSGQPERCATWLRAAEPLIDADPEPLPGWRSLRAAAATTWAAYAMPGDLDGALQHARTAVDLEDDPHLWGHVIARQSLAGALFATGAVSSAVDLLSQAWEAPVRRAGPELLQLQCAGALALGFVEMGRVDAAQRVCDEMRTAATVAETAWGAGAGAAVAAIRLAEARMLADGDPAAGLPAVNRAVELAESWGWPSLVIMALTTQAATQWALGERAATRRTLDRAREAAAGEPGRLLAVRQLGELEARIGRAAGSRARHDAALTEELTDRELAVLRALRGPLSAREIGTELYLSINTVKTYTKSVYRKLGVVSRADAVRRARELGLI